MPPEMNSRFLEATVNGLQENQPSCISISAVKAVYWFCKVSVAEDNSTLSDIVRSHLPSIFQGIFNLANQPSTEVLTLVMETLQVVVSVIIGPLIFSSLYPVFPCRYLMFVFLICSAGRGFHGYSGEQSLPANHRRVPEILWRSNDFRFMPRHIQELNAKSRLHRAVADPPGANVNEHVGCNANGQVKRR